MGLGGSSPLDLAWSEGIEKRLGVVQQDRKDAEARNERDVSVPEKLQVGPLAPVEPDPIEVLLAQRRIGNA